MEVEETDLIIAKKNQYKFFQHTVLKEQINKKTSENL